MIPRYTTPPITRIWSEENVFEKWLQVECAVLDAKAELGSIKLGIASRIRDQARFTVERIHELDAELHHDLLAFVQTVQESLDPELQPFFHADLTSYDTEEPATAILFLESLDVVISSVTHLIEVLHARAAEFQQLPCIARTHGQHAEPSIFGLRFLYIADQLERQLTDLEKNKNRMSVGKISGAVGTYGRRLSPKLERLALKRLGLRPAKIAGQIVFRDRHATVISTLAIIASIVENLAVNIRLLSQTEIGEVQEPFSAKQKGSSKMPHKKNPILDENLCGLSRVVRHHAAVATENIATWDARDISHSSAERIIFPDAFQLTHFMILRLTQVVRGLVVHRDRIQANLGLLQGVIFSGEVKDALLEAGLDPEHAYRLTQSAAFQALSEGQRYEVILQNLPELPETVRAKLPQLMSVMPSLQHVPAIFRRFGMTSDDAEPTGERT